MTFSPFGRVIEVAENGRHLSKADGFLVIEAGRERLGQVPLDDIAAVLATAPGTSVSCAALAALSERGIPVVLCDAKFLPSAIIWPLAGHHAQQRRMECQIDASLPLKKRLWTGLVAAKIKHQGLVLAGFGREASGFFALARAVRSGDPDNIEAQAARRYWPMLMGEGFRRDQDASGANALLNYGYTVLRASAARAIVAAGLHPGLGVFHRHPQNMMPLADDLMEVFRPFVDRRVVHLMAEGAQGVSTGAKRALVAVLSETLPTGMGQTPISTCLIRLAASLGESFVGCTADLDLPMIVFSLRDLPDAEP